MRKDAALVTVANTGVEELALRSGLEEFFVDLLLHAAIGVALSTAERYEQFRFVRQ